jgi:hypothetical protein
MTRDDIIRMARQVGFVLDEADFIYPNPRRSGIQLELERFATLVAQHEREACAKLCDSLEEQCEKLGLPDEKWPTPADCAAVIRARGNDAN